MARFAALAATAVLVSSAASAANLPALKFRDQAAEVSAAARLVSAYGIVSSTFRTVAHNRAVGGVPNSYHLLDRAKSWPAQAQGSIDVPSEHERRARQAQVQLSWGSMQLLPPDLPTGTQGRASPLPLCVVRVATAKPLWRKPSVMMNASNKSLMTVFSGLPSVRTQATWSAKWKT